MHGGAYKQGRITTCIAMYVDRYIHLYLCMCICICIHTFKDIHPSMHACWPAYIHRYFCLFKTFLFSSVSLSLSFCIQIVRMDTHKYTWQYISTNPQCKFHKRVFFLSER